EAGNAGRTGTSIEFTRVEACRPDHDGNPCLEAPVGVGEHRIRPREVDRDVAARRRVRPPGDDVAPRPPEGGAPPPPAALCPPRPGGGAEDGAALSRLAEEADLHDRSASAGLTRAT